MQDKRANWIHNDKNPSRDDLIVDLIKDQLEEKMQESSMDINLFCKDGYVHMYGMVDVLAEKKMAEDIAHQIEGVRKIENKITVAMDSNITNKHMQKEIIDTLSKDDALSSVGVKVEDGVANMIGSANTLKEAKRANTLAAKTRGIKDVVNNIKVASSEEYDDSSINNSLTSALNKTKFYNQDMKHVVNNGVATLSGYVNNRQEVELAKEIAMGIEGVNKIINKLKIRKDNQKQS